MRNIISTFLILSFVTIFGVIGASAQIGTRVYADIPFDFTVGKTTFAAGKYEMVLTKHFGSVYAVSLFDQNHKRILSTTAVQNGVTNPKDSDMVFSVATGGHFLEKLRTPEMGFQFVSTKSDRALVAQAKKVSVPTEASPNE
jgi:hypothetical protein